jgi:hypothetical protein
MLGERLADAPEIAALLQARVEVIQQRAADPAHFLDPERGLDGAADIPEVGLLRGDVPSGGEDVLVEQLGDGDVRVRLPPCACELEQLDKQLLYVTGGLTRQATQPQSRRSTNGSQIDRRSYRKRRWG